MSDEMRLSWSIGSAVGDVEVLEWDQVLQMIEYCWNLGGRVCLYFLGPDRAVNELEIRGQCSGAFLLSLLLDDSTLRDFYDPDVESYQVDVWGDWFDSRLICTNFKHIRDAFSQFYMHRDVSPELLS